MKRTLIFLTFSATALLFGACNKHSWDGEDGHLPTKNLFQDHGGEHAGEHKGEHKEDTPKTEGGEEKKAH